MARYLSLLIAVIPLIALGDEEGMVVYLPFDEGMGDIAKDISGNGHDGKIVNAEWTEGKLDKALNFNGQDAYVEIKYSDDFNIQDGITLAAWIKPGATSLQNWHGIINARKSTYGPYLLQTAVGFGEVGFYFSGAWRWLRTATTLKEGEWYHITATYDSSSGDIKIYTNGQLDIGGGTRKGTGKIDPNTAEGVVIGHNYGLAGRFFEGIIDEVVIYSRAISDEEVKELFDGSLKERLSPVQARGKLPTFWGRIKNK